MDKLMSDRKTKRYLYLTILFIMISFLSFITVYHIVSVKLSYIFKLSFINIFISNITPFATGGGFAQIYFLNKKGISVGQATAASTIRTVTPMIFFAIVTPLILIFDKGILQFMPERNNIILLALIAIYFYALYRVYRLIMNTEQVKRILYKALNWLGNKGIIKAERKDKLIKVILKEIDRFSLIQGLNPGVSSIEIILSQIVVTLIMYFSITPGATGIAEGGFVIMFARFVDQADIVSLTFGWRFFTVYIGMIIGLFIFYKEIFLNNKIENQTEKVKLNKAL